MKNNPKILVLLILLFSVQIANTAPALFLVKTYPLPSTNYVNIEVFQQIGGVDDIKVKLYDFDGKEIKNIDYEVFTVINMIKRIKIDTDNIKVGAYLAVIKSNEYSTTAKLIIQ